MQKLIRGKNDLVDAITIVRVFLKLKEMGISVKTGSLDDLLSDSITCKSPVCL